MAQDSVQHNPHQKNPKAGIFESEDGLVKVRMVLGCPAKGYAIYNHMPRKQI